MFTSRPSRCASAQTKLEQFAPLRAAEGRRARRRALVHLHDQHAADAARCIASRSAVMPSRVMLPLSQNQ